MLAVASSGGGVDVTGIATVALALATLGLAFAAVLQTRLVREQVRNARQPVLVPGGHDPSAAPRRSGGALLLPVVNVGMAPALQITGEVWADSQGKPGGESGRIRSRQPIPGLSAGAIGELVFPAPFDQTERFSLEIITRDAARVVHRTSAVWDPQHGFLDVITDSPRGEGSRKGEGSRG